MYIGIGEHIYIYTHYIYIYIHICIQTNWGGAFVWGLTLVFIAILMLSSMATGINFNIRVISRPPNEIKAELSPPGLWILGVFEDTCGGGCYDSAINVSWVPSLKLIVLHLKIDGWFRWVSFWGRPGLFQGGTVRCGSILVPTYLAYCYDSDPCASFHHDLNPIGFRDSTPKMSLRIQVCPGAQELHRSNPILFRWD